MALLVLRRRKREVLPFDCLSGKRLPWGNCSQWVGRGGGRFRSPRPIGRRRVRKGGKFWRGVVGIPPRNTHHCNALGFVELVEVRVFVVLLYVSVAVILPAGWAVVHSLIVRRCGFVLLWTTFPIGVGRAGSIVLTSRGCCRGSARAGGKVTWGSPYRRLFPDPRRGGKSQRVTLGFFLSCHDDLWLLGEVCGTDYTLLIVLRRFSFVFLLRMGFCWYRVNGVKLHFPYVRE